MKIIKRTIESTFTETSSRQQCQASFNSDGVITLRKYNQGNNQSDEIIILTPQETAAIMQLLQQMKSKLPSELPF